MGGRIAAVWLVAALVAGALGCDGPAPDPSGATTVVLWHAYRAGEESALIQAAEGWNAQHLEVQVEVQKIPYQAFADKITTAIPRDNGPDLFIFAHDRVGAWAEADVIEPISLWATERALEAYIKSTVEALVYKKALYGLPLTFKSVALFYNKALVPMPPKTDAELVEMARAATDPAKKQYGLAYMHNQLYFTAAFIHGFGGQTLDHDGGLHLTDPGTADALRFCRSLLEPHKVMPGNVDGAVLTNLFNTGRAAMVINGPWFIGELGGDVDWGVAVLPTIEKTGEPMAPFFGSEAIMMSRRSRHKRAAFAVMQYLAGAEASKIRMEVGGTPVAHRETWETAKSTPVQRVFKDQIEVAVGMPNRPDMRFVWEPTDQAIERVVKKGADAVEELARAQRRIEASR